MRTGGFCSLVDSAITDVQSSSGGGAYVLDGTISLIRSVIASTSVVNAYARAGAVYVSGRLTLEDSLLINTIATASIGIPAGGAIAMGGGFVTLINSAIINASSVGTSPAGNLAWGGAITVKQGSVTMIDSTIANCTVSGSPSFGGGLLLLTSASSCNLTRSKIVGTSAVGDNAQGGALNLQNGATCTLTSKSLADVSVQGVECAGGAIAIANGVCTMYASNITNAVAVGDNSEGGAVAFVRGNLTLESSIIAGSSATRTTNPGGGALCMLGSGVATLIDSTISDASAVGAFPSGGAIQLADGQLTLQNSHIISASARGTLPRGGAIVMSGGTLRLIGSTIREAFVKGSLTGTSAARGGAIYMEAAGSPPIGLQLTDASSSSRGVADCSLIIVNSTIVNTAALGTKPGGGGLYLIGGTTFISDSTITNATADSLGGTLDDGGGCINAALGEVMLHRTHLNNCRASMGAALSVAAFVQLVATFLNISHTCTDPTESPNLIHGDVPLILQALYVDAHGCDASQLLGNIFLAQCNTPSNALPRWLPLEQRSVCGLEAGCTTATTAGGHIRTPTCQCVDGAEPSTSISDAGLAPFDLTARGGCITPLVAANLTRLE